jgi:hypothetical protein
MMKEAPAATRPPPGSFVADVHGHFGGVGAEDEVGDSDQVEEALVVEQTSPGDELVGHHADVSDGSSQGGEPEPCEQAGDVPDGP